MSKLSVEQLEDRRVPASVTFANGTLAVQGDAAPHTFNLVDVDGKGDVIVYSPDGGGQGYYVGAHVIEYLNGGAADTVNAREGAWVSNGGNFFSGPSQGWWVFSLGGGANVSFNDDVGVLQGSLIVEVVGGNAHFSSSFWHLYGGQMFLLSYNTTGGLVTNNVFHGNVAPGALLNVYVEDFAPGGSQSVTYTGLIAGYANFAVYSYSTGNSYTLDLEATGWGWLNSYAYLRPSNTITYSRTDNSGGALNGESYLVAALVDMANDHLTGIDADNQYWY